MRVDFGPFAFIGLTTTLGALFHGDGALIGLAVGIATILAVSYWGNRNPYRF